MNNTYTVQSRRQEECGRNYIPGRAARLSRIREERRREQTVRRIKLTGIIVLLIITVFMTLSGFSSPAESSQEPYKYYKAVEVGSGDTLWSIASENISGDYSINSLIREIEDLNNIGEHIRYGQIIMVPYYSDEIK